MESTILFDMTLEMRELLRKILMELKKLNKELKNNKK